jgi:hypothetical protein
MIECWRVEKTVKTMKDTGDDQGKSTGGGGEGGEEKQVYGRALDGYEKTIGKDHPSTLHTLRCLKEARSKFGAKSRKQRRASHFRLVHHPWESRAKQNNQ